MALKLAACAVLAALLAACVQGPGQAWMIAPEAVVQAEAAVRAPLVLAPWRAITGGRLAVTTDANGFPLGALGRVATFIFPTALAVRGHDLYIADSGARLVYRYDAALQALIAVPGVAATQRTRLSVGADLSLFVLEAGRPVILRYGRGGQKLQELGDPLASASLGDFALDEARGLIYASDRQNMRLVVFHPLGKTARTLASAAGGEFTALVALSSSGRMLYAIDTGCSCIVVMNEEGRVLEPVGQGLLVQPRALAVDRHGHIFVADVFDRTLKVFLRGELAANYDARTLRVTEISALAVNEDTLYVADAPGSRVAVFRIQPP